MLEHRDGESRDGAEADHRADIRQEYMEEPVIKGRGRTVFAEPSFNTQFRAQN